MPDELAPFTTVFRASEQHRVKRNRQAVSCTACQKRKSRCDRKQPCGACEKRGDAATCRMGPAASAAAGKHEVQARLNKLEEMVRDLAEGSQAKSDDGGARRPAGNGQDVLAELNENYHGATSWTALVESIRDIQQALDADDDKDSPEHAPPKEPDVFFGDLHKVTIGDIVNSLPSRQDADRLVQAFFNAKFLAVPFLHSHQFRRRYEAFWENPSSASFLWISTLFSLLSAGAMVVQVKSLIVSSPETISNPDVYMLKSAQCLVAGEYLKAGPWSVEALLMHANSRNVQKKDSDPSIWSMYGLAIRLAQRRGYHRDPAKLSASISPFEAEMRRRTWFTIQSMDLLFSFQHGMPPMIYEEVCDVGPPTNLTDDDFDEDTPLPPARQPNDPIPMLAYIIKARLCHILRRIIRLALAVEPAPYSETLELNRELQEYHETIPPSLKIRSIRGTSFTDQSYTIMHRLMLELMYLKSLCVLHRPYLTVGKNDMKYHESREICRNAALRSIELHIELDQETKPGGRMYEDRYMVSSLTLHDFLIAAMVVCLDLSESTNVSPDDRAYRIMYLRKAHSIWSDQSSKSLDALHASRVLRAILNKVESPSAPSESTTLVAEHSNEATPYSNSNGQEQLVPGTESVVEPVPYRNERHEFHMNFDEMAQFETFFDNSNTAALDWNSIDHYLRSDPMDTFSWDQTFPELAS